LKIKSILVSQPAPEQGKSPYQELAERKNIKIDFRSFIQVEGVSSKEFRKQRIDILAHTAIVFTSKKAVDYFFQMCEELRITTPDGMKYFCISEAIAFYLQKYIVYRKRKVFYPEVGDFDALADEMTKHKNEKYLVPLSEQHKPEIPKKLKKCKLNFTKAILYRTVNSDLSDLTDVNYDMLVFYSPSGIRSLFDNFPNFQQNETKIAAFGPSTYKAIKDAGLRCDVKAPGQQTPSMTAAIEQFIDKESKKCVKK